MCSAELTSFEKLSEGTGPIPVYVSSREGNREGAVRYGSDLSRLRVLLATADSTGFYRQLTESEPPLTIRFFRSNPLFASIKEDYENGTCLYDGADIEALKRRAFIVKVSNPTLSDLGLRVMLSNQNPHWSIVGLRKATTNDDGASFYSFGTDEAYRACGKRVPDRLSMTVLPQLTHNTCKQKVVGRGRRWHQQGLIGPQANEKRIHHPKILYPEAFPCLKQYEAASYPKINDRIAEKLLAVKPFSMGYLARKQDQIELQGLCELLLTAQSRHDLSQQQLDFVQWLSGFDFMRRELRHWNTYRGCFQHVVLFGLVEDERGLCAMGYWLDGWLQDGSEAGLRELVRAGREWCSIAIRPNGPAVDEWKAGGPLQERDDWDDIERLVEGGREEFKDRRVYMCARTTDRVLDVTLTVRSEARRLFEKVAKSVSSNRDELHKALKGRDASLPESSRPQISENYSVVEGEETTELFTYSDKFAGRHAFQRFLRRHIEVIESVEARYLASRHGWNAEWDKDYHAEIYPPNGSGHGVRWGSYYMLWRYACAAGASVAELAEPSLMAMDFGPRVSHTSQRHGSERAGLRKSLSGLGVLDEAGNVAGDSILSKLDEAWAEANERRIAGKPGSFKMANPPSETQRRATGTELAEDDWPSPEPRGIDDAPLDEDEEREPLGEDWILTLVCALTDRTRFTGRDDQEREISWYGVSMRELCGFMHLQSRYIPNDRPSLAEECGELVRMIDVLASRRLYCGGGDGNVSAMSVRLTPICEGDVRDAIILQAVEAVGQDENDGPSVTYRSNTSPIRPMHREAALDAWLLYCETALGATDVLVLLEYGDSKTLCEDGHWLAPLDLNLCLTNSFFKVVREKNDYVYPLCDYGSPLLPLGQDQADAHQVLYDKVEQAIEVGAAIKLPFAHVGPFAFGGLDYSTEVNLDASNEVTDLNNTPLPDGSIVRPLKEFPRNGAGEVPLLCERWSQEDDGLWTTSGIWLVNLSAWDRMSLNTHMLGQIDVPMLELPKPPSHRGLDCWSVFDLGSVDDASEEILRLGDDERLRLRFYEIENRRARRSLLAEVGKVLEGHGWVLLDEVKDGDGGFVRERSWGTLPGTTIIGLRELHRFILSYGSNVTVEGPVEQQEWHIRTAWSGAEELLSKFIGSGYIKGKQE